MTIAYIAFWGLADGLTKATVYPAIRRLSEIKEVSKIILITIERDSNSVTNLNESFSPKISVAPFYINKNKSSLFAFNKFRELISLPKKLIDYFQKNQVKLIFCRGAMAGIIGYKIKKKTQIPFIVESFEPHAAYMHDAREWSKFGLKYHVQKRWESKEKKEADFLITVTKRYAEKLLQEGIDKQKIRTITCYPDYDLFKFDIVKRLSLRTSLNFENKIIGIYSGKFGGIYYDYEAFEIFKAAIDYFGRGKFYLIILSPDDARLIHQKLERVGFPIKNAMIKHVHHKDVPDFLSAADFGFSTIKPGASRQYCSPVKNGEYWASGLPILLTEGVGDDHMIIEFNKTAGAIYSLKKNNLREGLSQISNILHEPNHRQINRLLVEKYRPDSVVARIYQEIITKWT